MPAARSARDVRFDVREQPYSAATGDDIDLEDVLPRGGAFSLDPTTGGGVTGDLNCDGVVNTLDIEPFLNLLFP